MQCLFNQKLIILSENCLFLRGFTVLCNTGATFTEWEIIVNFILKEYFIDIKYLSCAYLDLICYVLFISEYHNSYFMGHTPRRWFLKKSIKAAVAGFWVYGFPIPHWSFLWTLSCSHVIIHRLSLTLLKINERYIPQTETVTYNLTTITTMCLRSL